MSESEQQSIGHAPSSASVPLLLEPLLGVHSVPSTAWLADAADTAAQRGLGALYTLLYLKGTADTLAGERPASSERMRSLSRVHQALGTDLTALTLTPADFPNVSAALLEGHARSITSLTDALPLGTNAEAVRAAQRQLGIATAWIVPLHWDGVSLGVLLLLMPKETSATLAEAELLGRHIAVAITNLRQRETGRMRGELDAVRWVYDEERFKMELEQEIRRARRHQRPLSIMVLRVNNLDELRIRYGRFLAEQLLRQFGNQLAEAMRDTDFLGAFREDGFGTILVEADEKGAQRAKQRLLADVRTIRQPALDLPNLHLEISCTTATLPGDGETAEELANAAASRLIQEAAA